MRDTIFAPATAGGRAAVAIVRVSGPGAAKSATALCGALPEPRYAALRKLRSVDLLLDEGLVLWMPGPQSFTGEDCVEFHLHGGVAVVEGVCSALAATGARLAEPGEFTRRAFEAGRLDLTQAEAVADLIDAETEAQRTQATGQLSGALSARFLAWRDQLIDALAFLEAGIDFPEEDIPDGVVSRATPLIERVADDIENEVRRRDGQQVRDGLTIALVGSPNVGKSSILNLLVGKEAAIVTPFAGTTRDIVEVSLVIAGRSVRLADTAGLRETEDVIELEGVKRAQRWAEHADIRIAIGDATRPETITHAKQLWRDGDILAVNKTDLADVPPASHGAIGAAAALGDVTDLWDAIRQRVSHLTAGYDFPAITRERHRELLNRCLIDLRRALSQKSGAELVGEDLRLAVRALESVTGLTNPEAILDRVFSSFCIGK